jgi:hypothetical protein
MVRRAVVVLLLVAASAQAAPKSKLPVVKLLDAGTGAKQKLRIHPVVGSKRTLVMKIRMAMELDAGPMMRLPHTDLPIMKMTFDTKVLEIDAKGVAKYEMVVTKIDVEQGKAAASLVPSVKASVDKLVGLKGWATVDSRNFTLAGAFDVPATGDPSTKQMMDSMSQSMSQLSAPLPDEAVGVGAKWSVDATMPANGIVLAQTGTYEITKLDGDHVAAKVAMKQTADAQEAHVPGMAGATLSVVSWKGTGAGTMELDLGKEVLPVHASLAVTEDARFAIIAGKDHQDMSMGLDLGVDL